MKILESEGMKKGYVIFSLRYLKEQEEDWEGVKG